MALFTFTKMFALPLKASAKNLVFNSPVRNLMSKQLVYSQFGDPLDVVKFRVSKVPELRPTEVLVRMLAAPVNPADINTIQGINYMLPCLPHVPGEEGVGNVVEIGSLVSRVDVGDRVIISNRLLGTWSYYGIYNERDLHIISKNLSLPEASMIAIAPCTAYRLINDFRNVNHGETIVQNAANSPVGQCVIQLCHALGINTLNIVSSPCDFEAVKNHLLSLGGTGVVTLDEASWLTRFDTSLVRPVLGFNCLGGVHENVLLNLLQTDGSVVYYGCARNLPFHYKKRPDLEYSSFDISKWYQCVDDVTKEIMLRDVTTLMITGKMVAPRHEPIELKNYMYALKNTVHCEAFCTNSFIFDFTLP